MRTFQLWNTNRAEGEPMHKNTNEKITQRLESQIDYIKKALTTNFKSQTADWN